MKKLNINENFISRIWLNSAYYSELKTTVGQTVRVIEYGTKNEDAGADFSNAIIKIDGKMYSGDVEIHKTFSDWKQHKHKQNKKYNKVILQVVMWGNEDKGHQSIPVMSRLRAIPTVVLSEFLSFSIHDIWKDIINNPSTAFRIPCYESKDKIDEEIRHDYINSLGLTRLRYRAKRISDRFDALACLNPDEGRKHILEKLLFEYICEALGFSKNKVQFLKFASSVDFRRLRKHCFSQTDYDTAFFGISGFLNDNRAKDEYSTRLKNRWQVLKNELKFESMDRSEWNFFRLRPANFPTLRMSYASSIAFSIINNNMPEKITGIFNDDRPFSKMEIILRSAENSSYWKTHYDFGRKSSVRYGIGSARISDIIINVFLPFLYFYSEISENAEMKNKVTEIYSVIKEKSDNKIIRVMRKQLGYRSSTARENQGLIHLHNYYCTRQKCSSCRIGRHLTSGEGVSEVLNIIIY